VPKLAAERRRRNTTADPTLLTLPAANASTPPEADESWHPVIRHWWAGIVNAPQAELFTSSDWGLCLYLAHRESVNLQQSRPSAQASALFLAAQSDLLTTEGSRRRLRVEVDHRVVHDSARLLAKWATQ